MAAERREPRKMRKGRSLVEGSGFLLFGGDWFGRHVVEVVGVI